MKSGVDNVNLMNRTIAIIAVSLWAASLPAAQESPVFNPTNLAPGTVVRIVAKRPAINLGHAEVLQCTSNQITVRQSGGSVSAGTFSVASANVLELAIVESAKGSTPAENREGTATTDAPSKRPASTTETSSEPGRPAPPKTNLWERLKGFWK